MEMLSMLLAFLWVGGVFPPQRATNAENMSRAWHHHEVFCATLPQTSSFHFLPWGTPIVLSNLWICTGKNTWIIYIRYSCGRSHMQIRLIFVFPSIQLWHHKISTTLSVLKLVFEFFRFSYVGIAYIKGVQWSVKGYFGIEKIVYIYIWYPYIKAYFTYSCHCIIIFSQLGCVQ